MDSAQQRKQALIDHKVITDVLPGAVTLSYSLTLKWPNATLSTPGQELDRDATQEEPKVYLDPVPSEPLENLVLIMIDPDLMMNNDTYFGQVRHWLVPSLTSSPSGSLSLSNPATQHPYIGPAPLPNYLYARPHRYVFILAQSSSSICISAEDLRALQKPYSAAVSGNQGEAQDLKDRWGFNAQGLIEMKGLEVLGATVMRVGGNLESAGKNMSMMSEAVVNKALGK